jgi:hypothetical protein
MRRKHLVKVITDREEILRVSTHLVNSERRGWMTLETAETDMPLSEDNLISCHRLSAGRSASAASMTRPPRVSRRRCPTCSGA